MSEFYTIIARKIFLPIFFLGGEVMLIANFTNIIMFQCV